MRRNGLPTLPTVPKKLGEHQERIRKLEFRKVGSGWEFNTDNEGGWGYVITNDSTDIEWGEWGLVLGDKSVEGVFVFATDPDTAEIASVGITQDEIGIGVSNSFAISLNRTLGKFTVYDNGVKVMEMTSGSPDLHLPTGGNVVFDL